MRLYIFILLLAVISSDLTSGCTSDEDCNGGVCNHSGMISDSCYCGAVIQDGSYCNSTISDGIIDNEQITVHFIELGANIPFNVTRAKKALKLILSYENERYILLSNDSARKSDVFKIYTDTNISATNKYTIRIPRDSAIMEELGLSNFDIRKHDKHHDPVDTEVIKILQVLEIIRNKCIYVAYSSYFNSFGIGIILAFLISYFGFHWFPLIKTRKSKICGATSTIKETQFQGIKIPSNEYMAVATESQLDNLNRATSEGQDKSQEPEYSHKLIDTDH